MTITTAQTTTASTGQVAPDAPGTPSRRSLAAGVGHAAVWVAGLTVAAGATPKLGDSAAEVTSAYAGDAGRAVAQSVLVHGLAAGALAVLGIALLRRAGGDRGARFAGWAGTTAAGLAVLQLVLELVAIGRADAADPGLAGGLFDLVQRIDGVKMFALAALAVGAVAARRVVPLRRWESFTGYALAAAIVGSGLGYLLLNTALGGLALLSLPLLLVWVLALGHALSRRPGRR
ncbi:hypothetical protein [Embleya sp. NPDC059259]|uniref:hypothetical protein n=1 Tax=unclassified Embleya TaxID=2699296 RepID=UPI0036CE6595